MAILEAKSGWQVESIERKKEREKSLSKLS